MGGNRLRGGGPRGRGGAAGPPGAALLVVLLAAAAGSRAEPCEGEAETGPCRAAMRMWAFDAGSELCREFIYGGCAGNPDNRFETREECLETCLRDGGDEDEDEEEEEEEEEEDGSDDAEEDLMQLHLLDPAQEAPGGRCLDGSPAGYYYSPPSSGTGSRWVLNLEGGGACFDAGDCAERAASPLGSSVEWDPERDGDEMLMSRDPERNPLHDFHHVLIPYCTGDAHAGGRAEPFAFPTDDDSDADGGEFWFDGALNLRRIVADLDAEYGLGAATEVLLTGISAGGVGTVYNVDSLQALLPAATVKGAPVAGLFSPLSLPFASGAPVPEGTALTDFPSFLEGRVGGIANSALLAGTWAIDLPAACEAKYGENCTGSLGQVYEFVEAPLFWSQNVWDSYDACVFQGVACEVDEESGEVTFQPAVAVPGEDEVASVPDAQLQQYLSYFGGSTVATLANATGPPWEVEALAALTPEKAARDGLFLPACGLHAENAAICSSETTIELPGGAAVDNCAVFKAWFFGEPGAPTRVVDGCDEPNCNPTCVPASME